MIRLKKLPVFIMLFLICLFSVAHTGQAAGADGFGEDGGAFIYFYVSPCDACDRAKEILDALVSKYDVNLIRLNVYEEKNLNLHHHLSDINDIESKNRKTPIIFYDGGYVTDFTYDGVERVFLHEKGVTLSDTGSSETTGYGMRDLAMLFTTGLINGLNPCSISMIFLLFSLLTARRLNTLKYGFTYIAGKIIVYFGIGVLLYAVTSSIDLTPFKAISDIITVILIIAAFVLSIMNMRDFFAAKNEHYDKIRMQLPRALRGFNHRLINAAFDKGNEKIFLLIIFILAVFISAGEFLCTGQIYIATILYMSKAAQTLNAMTLLCFLVYVIAMAIPLAVITVVISLGKKTFEVSETVRKNMPLIKLLNAAVFAAFGVYMIIMLL